MGTGVFDPQRIRDYGLARRLREHVWWFALAAGAVTGCVILGVGGRIAMRFFALHTGARPGFSLGGTITVIFMGVVSGVAGAAIRAAAATWLPKRVPAWIGSVIFAMACMLLTLRGLKPVDAARLTYFLPCTVGYIIAFELLWWRWTVLRHRVVTPGDAA
jgi:hypothetical protein